MSEVKCYFGKLVLSSQWSIIIDFATKKMNRTFGVTLDSNCKQTAPYAGKVLNLDEIKELHKLLEAVINERENNME